MCACWKELIHVCVLEGINTCVHVGRNKYMCACWKELKHVCV